MWTDLNKRFNKVNGSRIFQLHREIAFTNQGVDSITICFWGLKLLWDKFASICYLPICNFKEFKAHIHHQNNIKLFQFLMGLNESYTNVRFNLLIRVPLPTLNQAYYILVQEESQRRLARIISSSNSSWTAAATSKETVSFSLDTQRRNNYQRTPRRFWICQQFHKRWHNMETCWILHPELKTFWSNQ